MSSSPLNARLTKGRSLEANLGRALPCPECGKLAMKRVRGPCTLREGTVIADLERLRCGSCQANFFDDAAMRAIAEFRRHLSRKTLAVRQR